MKLLYLALFTLFFLQADNGLCQCSFSAAPIPNRSFEHWVTRGNYLDPIDWTTNNDSTYSPVIRDSIDKVDSSYSMRVEQFGIARSKRFFFVLDIVTTVKYTIVSGDTITLRLIHYNAAGNVVDSIGYNLITSDNRWHRLTFPRRFSNPADSVEVLVIGGKLPGTTINMDCMVQYAESVQDVINGQKVTLYPNPVNHIATLHFNNKQHASFNLSMLSADGKMVYRENNNTSEVFTVDCSNLPGGIYFWNISDPRSNVRAIGKIVVK